MEGNELVARKDEDATEARAILRRMRRDEVPIGIAS